MNYQLKLEDGGFNSEIITIEEEDDFGAIRTAREELTDYIQGVEWGDEHTNIHGEWKLRRLATEEEINDPKRPSIIRHEVGKDDIVEGRFCDRNTEHNFDYDDDDDKLYFKISEDMTINVEG